MSKLPLPLLELIDHLKKLPGVGNKTAERYAFELLTWDSKSLNLFIESLSRLKEKIQFCPTCHCLSDQHCAYCDNPRRIQSLLCIIEKPLDVFTLEKTGSYSGLYHALGGLLNPLSAQSEASLNIQSLLDRIDGSISEVIIALDATLEGEATTLLVQEKLKNLPIVVSRLAYGIPIGSPLNYVDGGTLSRALTSRSRLS